MYISSPRTPLWGATRVLSRQTSNILFDTRKCFGAIITSVINSRSELADVLNKEHAVRPTVLYEPGRRIVEEGNEGPAAQP